MSFQFSDDGRKELRRALAKPSVFSDVDVIAAAFHGRRYVVDALRRTLMRGPVHRLEAELATEALRELGAKPTAPPRLTRRITWDGGPPVVLLAIARTFARTSAVAKAHKAAA
jgi:hypothetical protein